MENKHQKNGISLSTLLLLIILGAFVYYTVNYAIELPGRKATEVKEKISSKVAPAIEKALSKEGKTFKVIEIGKNYIRIKGYFFTKNITHADLTEPIQPGTTELMKVGEKYTPLVK